ncbi:MAG: ribosome silencing factor [Actinobacteria bacterium]|nr:ribosome silencing factor [Actinomycetota bacterium]
MTDKNESRIKGRGKIDNHVPVDPGEKYRKKILTIVREVADIADEKNAGYIKILDMSSRLIITDYFIIISARNTRLTRRIEEEICFRLKKKKMYPLNIDGTADGNWILIDYDDFVIHIFTEELRQFYDLERLWKDSKEIKWKKTNKPEIGPGSERKHFET